MINRDTSIGCGARQDLSASAYMEWATVDVGICTTPLPRLNDVVGGAPRQRHDGQHRVKAAVGHMYRTIRDEQVIVAMHLAPRIDHRGLWIVAHAARHDVISSSSVVHVVMGISPS